MTPSSGNAGGKVGLALGSGAAKGWAHIGVIRIMQVRIGRSRMAGDPPEMLVTPRMSDFSLVDFDRADEAIDEGRRAVARALAVETPQ